ncbi:MAG TPA: hypothetical protein VF629_19565 [Hymenobacter sp.]|uniref:hypothetical protein n=1 Tax=Hymenobacter sp. TaxID=1898978 RepID=UPI002ED93E27
MPLFNPPNGGAGLGRDGGGVLVDAVTDLAQGQLAGHVAAVELTGNRTGYAARSLHGGEDPLNEVPTLCFAIVHRFGSSRIHRLFL